MFYKTFLFLTLTSLNINSIYSQNEFLKAKFQTKISQSGQNGSNSDIKRSIVFQPEIAINYLWSSSIGDWDYIDTSYFEYDSEGYVIKHTNRDSGLDIVRYLTTYTESHKKTEVITQNFNQSLMSWVNFKRSVQIFNEHDHVIEYRYENWNTSTSEWETTYGSKYFRTYDINNHQVETIYQDYQINTDSFVNRTKYINIYDSQGRLTSYEEISWFSNQWQNNFIEHYNYVSDVVTSIVTQEWNGTNYANTVRYNNIVWYNWTEVNVSEALSLTVQNWDNNTWVNIGRSNFTYDSFGGSVEISQNFINNSWVNAYKYTETYDFLQHYIGDRGEEWINNTWLIREENRNIYSYNAEDQIIRKIEQQWDDFDLNFDNRIRTDYLNYMSFTNSAEIDEQQNNTFVKVYPNPFTSKLNIEIDAKLSEKAEFILTDLSGKIVLKLKASSNFSIEKGKLESGFYNFTILDTNLNKSGKIIIE